jgi:AraC-like DNA-binding protein
MSASTHSAPRSTAAGGGLLSDSAAASWQSLAPVLAAADELAAHSDIQQMLRGAVEMARERFGLERVGLYLRDPRSEPVIMRGTWGTSATRTTTSEHAHYHECKPPDVEHLCTLQQNGALWHQVERPLLCPEDPRRDTQFGVGWLVVTPLVAARELVGVMYNDAALSRAPVDELKQVRTAVFCSHVAALFLARRSRFEWAVTPASHDRPWLRRATEALDENPCMSGARLARQLSISSGHLSRSFKAELGISLVEYRHRRLMERFFDALERGQVNLLAAALDAGFSSYTQFHRVYRKLFGKNPSDGVPRLRADAAARGPSDEAKRRSPA